MRYADANARTTRLSGWLTRSGAILLQIAPLRQRNRGRDLPSSSLSFSVTVEFSLFLSRYILGGTGEKFQSPACRPLSYRFAVIACHVAPARTLPAARCDGAVSSGSEHTPRRRGGPARVSRFTEVPNKPAFLYAELCPIPRVVCRLACRACHRKYRCA